MNLNSVLINLNIIPEYQYIYAIYKQGVSYLHDKTITVLMSRYL